MTAIQTSEVVGAVTVAAHIIGIGHALHAIFRVRTSQGAIAWAISLATFPWIALPLYWVFGRDTYSAYQQSRRRENHAIEGILNPATAALDTCRVSLPPDISFLTQSVEPLVGLPCTGGNAVDLLTEGEAAFNAMLEAIAAAREYVLIQFFIVEDGELANRFEEVLAECIRRDVAVYFLYDELGSRKLSKRYLRKLREIGVHVDSFRAIRGRGHQIQLNFWNHRKVTVVDGRIAFIGGLNLGDEYVGKHPRLTPWRDTHLRIEGPAVQAIQQAFLKDWHWAGGYTPDLRWTPQSGRRDGMTLLVVPTGPADTTRTCQLMFLALINAARERLWIASPYFVPDPAIVAALQLAALRGVDVRIILPENPDHIMVYLAAFSYYDEMIGAGVKIYRYTEGFMHQKVVLVDDRVAAVGTANLDNRSTMLNFEITVLCPDQPFAEKVKTMLQEDLAKCREATVRDFSSRNPAFKTLVYIARLLAPIL